MAVLRTLVTRLVLEADKAFKGLKTYDKLWAATAKSVEASATLIEKAADRAGLAVAKMAAGAAEVRANVRMAGGGGGGGGTGGSRGPRPARTSNPEIDRVVREGQRERARQEREAERRAVQAEREAARRSAAHERGESRSRRSDARMAGLAAGAAPVNEATAALGRFATASDRAKAKVDDLTAQVARNRREMADLKEQALRTGDADGTLAGKMQGLAVATGKAESQLGNARRELRNLDGGFMAAVKKAASLETRVVALGTALGNFGYDLAKRGFGLVKDSLVGSAEAAMDFEKALVDVAKVAKDADLTKEGLLDPRVKDGIKEVAKELGVMPTEVAELTAQITAAFSGKTDIVALASDVTKIGVAWDISGKQAGEYFKQTSAGLQINADETKLLFGSINQLGNELGIKSSEIAEAMTRSAGVIKGANLSGETGAALNATLIKAGASAEVAATGVRTFIARLGAGEAATDKQIHAFNALGLSAEKVAKNLASGDAARAEAQIQEVVAALVKMGETAPDQRMATLIQLFGSESIGSIGAAATAVDTLAASFAIAGDKAKAATSVQQEYDRVSNTSAARVEKLKANIGVLAIELGENLLPHIDRLVNFLTSPEGQEWGASAVSKAVAIISGLATVVGHVADGMLIVAQNTDLAVVGIGLLAVAVNALLGPWGLLAAAVVGLGSYLGGTFPEQVRKGWEEQETFVRNLISGGERIRELISDLRRHDGVFAKVSDRWRELMLRIMGATNALGEFYRKQDAEEVRTGKLAHEEAKKREVDRQREDQAKRTRRAAEADGERRARETGAETISDTFIDSDGNADISAMNEESKRRLFNKLLPNRKHLRPSERKILNALSKDLDEAIPTGSGKGRSHKATKMDRQLAAMDPSLAAVLRTGGEEDAGGDLKVHDDPLSKAVFQRANAGKGGLGGLSSGSGGLGPGPNITNHNYFNNFSVSQTIDARGNGDAAQNIAASADRMGQAVNQVQFTGVERVLASRNAGGRMA